MDFDLVFQQVIDRQDRTLQTEGRFSLLEPLEIQQPQQESLPLPDKDSSHDDMPCRHPSIEATTPATPPAGKTRPTDSFASRTP